MKKKDVDDKIAALKERNPTWFKADHEQWGMYAMSYMPGWIPILEKLMQGIEQTLTPEEQQSFWIGQIKEKFGGLRFYTHGLTEENYKAVGALIRKAEEEAAHTCMFCGDEGRLFADAWHVTLCDYHHKLGEEQRLDDDYEAMTTPAPRH